MKAADYFTKIQRKCSKSSKSSKEKMDLISVELTDFRCISGTKQRDAEKAIKWLLSKAPHSVEEIADHFYLSTDLVKHILDPLVAELAVVEGTQL